MVHDVEAAGLASAGGISSGDHHPVKAGEPCRNCGHPVEQRFCTECGQLGSDFHRPIWDLAASSFADMFSLDGRLVRTVPMLMFQPGRMTRSYIDGQRARFVPPFRLFLLTSVIFFLTVFWVLEHQPWMKEIKIDLNPGTAGQVNMGAGSEFKIGIPPDTEALKARLEQPDLTAEERQQIERALERMPDQESLTPFFLPDGTVDREALRASVIASNPDLTDAEIKTALVNADRLANVYENQERFVTRMKEWAPRFTLLFLPIFSTLLALSYAWHRKRYFYDHLITGLHFQTFVYVLATLLMILSTVVPAAAGYAAGGSFLLIFVYLWRMLRVTYDTGYILAFLRALFLLLAGLMALSVLATGLILLSFLLT